MNTENKKNDVELSAPAMKIKQDAVVTAQLLSNDSIVEAGVAYAAALKRNEGSIINYAAALLAFDGLGAFWANQKQVKIGIQFLNEKFGVSRSDFATITEKNRYDYYYRTLCQVVCEGLGYVDAETSVFDLSAYLGKVIAKLEKENVSSEVIETVKSLLDVA